MSVLNVKNVIILLAISFNIFWVLKNRLIEMILLSTRNIFFGWEIRNIIFNYALLSGGLAFFKIYIIKYILANCELNAIQCDNSLIDN